MSDDPVEPGGAWIDAIRELARLSAEVARVQEKIARDLGPVERSPSRDLGELTLVLARIESKIDAFSLLSSSPEIARPVEAAPEPPALADMGEWGRAFFGRELWEMPGIEADCNRLIQGVLGGEPEASSLAAFLLLFRCSPPERMSQLIKDLGESYYRWQPKLTDRPTPFETALSNWLNQSIETAGVRNRIELVRPGTRFNPQHHKSTDRGIEVVQALGWVVIREDGSVYQKANVAVR
jgi:hypothetical protein